MSLPPPPGVRSPHLPPNHSTLPPRPPSSNPASSVLNASASIAPTTYSSAPGTHRSRESFDHRGSNASTRPHNLTFQPRTVVTQNQSLRFGTPTVSAAPTPPSNFTSLTGTEYGSKGFDTLLPQRALSSHSLNSTNLNGEHNHYQTPPSIRNPFPTPGQFADGRPVPHGHDITDPEMEAQIAQWQSAYAGKDTNQSTLRGLNRFSDSSQITSMSNGASQGLRTENPGSYSSSANTDTAVASVITASDGKQKTVVRHGGGQTWQDPSLLEWDPAHFRLFVGNLAGEVTDDSLLKAFSRYASIQKARVVRDKRTTKSKGFGFVSFADGEEYFQAARDMQGKYIGSHPVLLRKSTTEIRPTASKDSRRAIKGTKGAGRRDHSAPNVGQGIQKFNGKVKNGLKLLG